jgi:dienelactone hydrolase
MRMLAPILASAILLAFSVGRSIAAETLPGTQPWTLEGDPASLMVEGIDRFLLRQIEEACERDHAPGTREKLAKIIGAHDERLPCRELQYVGGTSQPALVGRGDGFEVFAVRWPVLRGIEGEGLLLVPTGRKAVANCVAIPDADHTPEMLVGLVPGVAPESQFARRLAENGCRVVVPLLIDRDDTCSVTGAGRATNQPHREFVYRPAFELGRHIIGYEVQKVLALVDWFTHEAGEKGDPRIGVMGYGEGGLLALHAGALDERIDVTCVSGYFNSRQNVWQEPIYRNVFGLLPDYGDAELAAMIAPRALIIEESRAPQVSGPQEPRAGRSGAAPGRIATPEPTTVENEVLRATKLVQGASADIGMASSGQGDGPFGSEVALSQFFAQVRKDSQDSRQQLAPLGASPALLAKGFQPAPRLKRQMDQLLEDTQVLMRESEYTRETFFSKVDRTSLEKFQQTIEPYRETFYKDVIGRFDLPLEKPSPRTRKVYDEPKYIGYEVQLDVFPDVFAYGILLLPKDIQPGQRRPVVVCQHGLEGRPQDVADPKVDHRAYHRYACRLAEEGFVVYAPQNPYIFQDRFRTLQRKANPLGKTLFSIIVPQHQQTVDWLASLEFVDRERIAFYGLSYGGKTAMRVPALVKGYCLSICSADFNEWIWKNASLRARYSYVGTGEYEIFEFDLGNTFNYAEMAALIAPRPFMVERGHHDGVAPDHWVAYEYAKVRRLYVDLKIADRTEIEFFDGPHTIHGVGTFAFLRQHLRWPGKKLTAAATD